MPRGLRCKPRGSVAGFIRDRPEAQPYPLHQSSVLSAATAAKWQTRHQQDRVTGASARAAVHLPPRAVPPGLFILAGSRLFSTRERMSGDGLGHCRAVLIFH